MSLQRQISFTAALRDMRRDRDPVQPGFGRARAHINAIARARRISVIKPNGSYDLAAIMSLAAGAARAQQARTGEPWAVCMSAALKAAWFSAKVARLSRAH